LQSSSNSFQTVHDRLVDLKSLIQVEKIKSEISKLADQNEIQGV